MEKQKFEFGFDVSALSDWSDETGKSFVKKMIESSKTLATGVEVVPGNKNIIKMPILSSDVFIQSDATCAYAPTGTTTITQLVLEVTPLKHDFEFCIKDLRTKYTQEYLTAGSMEEFTTTIMDKISEDKKEKLALANEYQIWQGDTTNSAATYQAIDGFVYWASTGATVDASSGSSGPHTASNIIAHVDNMIDNLPAAILDRTDLTLYMSIQYYNMYTSAIAKAWGSYQSIQDLKSNSDLGFVCWVPGKNVKVIGMPGLVNSDKFILTYAKNLYVTCDVLGEEENLYSEYFRLESKLKCTVHYKLGTQIAFPEHVVINW